MTAAVCLIGFTLAQSVQLFINYNLKETMWKKHEKLEEGEMPTPTIIFCPEPPSRVSARIISHARPNQDYTLKPPIEIFRTVLKVIYLLISIVSNLSNKALDNLFRRDIVMLFRALQ